MSRYMCVGRPQLPFAGAYGTARRPERDAMSDHATTPDRRKSASAPQGATLGFLLGRLARAFANSDVPFEICLPTGRVQSFGRGAPSFRVVLKNRHAVRAIASLDEGRFADSYLAGDIDLDGDMLRPFELRKSMGDFHLLTSAWRFVQPLLFGQTRTNRSAISSHYDIDPDFFLSLLDPVTPCYTQGIYESALRRHSAVPHCGNSTTASTS
jgi:cyclopropane-fatty-acyl-phospholipid synthase